MLRRDPLVQPASAAQVAAFAAQRNVSEDKARETLEALRCRQIDARAADPYRYGYEPPIWYVAKALIRNPAWSDYERLQIRKRLGDDWTAEDFAEKMRRRLGFQYPVTRLLVMGSNRSGKTDFSAKLSMQTAREGNKFIGSGAQTLKTQKQNQMARIWRYMPAEWQAKNIANKKAKDVVENISYTPKNGFAGSKVTFENGSILNFVTYEQNIAALEGVEYDLVHLDEEYGIDYYNLMTTRITSRAGVFLGTFTPLHGYTPQIAKFLDGAIVTRYHTAYLRPIDGGEKLPHAELNLSKEEYEELVTWRKEGQTRTCNVPESRPEDCFEWLFDEGDGRNSLNIPRGRAFDFTPRVAICQGGEAAAVWFFGSDNPYGLPAELIAAKMADQNAEQKIYEAVYGMARDMKGRIFKSSHIDAAIVEPSEIPEELIRFTVIDPAPERNWVIGWFGFSPATKTLYMLKEWPGNYEIPGHGVPGPWVIPSDRNGGVNDGARGDAQTAFGFGYNHYKFEIARHERWQDYLDWERMNGVPDRMPSDMSFVETWSEANGTGEPQEFRLLDCRAASQSKISASSSRTLFEDMDSLLLGMALADGQRTEVGYTKMIDLFAAGKLKISKNCVNAVDCLKMLTGKDGQKGAAKDMVDLLRYAVMSDIWNYTMDALTRVKNAHGRENCALGRGNHAQRRGPQRGASGRVWW